MDIGADIGVDVETEKFCAIIIMGQARGVSSISLTRGAGRFTV